MAHGERGTRLSRTSLNHSSAPGGVGSVQPCSGHCFSIARGTLQSQGARGQRNHIKPLSSASLPEHSPEAAPNPGRPSLGTDLCSLQVFFSRDQSRAQLVIDGLRAQGAAVATPGLFVAQTPLYVGGLPAGKAKAHIPVRAWQCHGISLARPVPSAMASPRAFTPSVLSGLSPQAASASSFDGCLRNPQLDGRPLGPPSRTFGVTPCYEGTLESGVFFTADGGSITLGTPLQPGTGRITFHMNPLGLLLTSGISLPADAVMTEQDLEVTLEVRPRSASGLIFHIGTRRSHHLLLYMEETKVLAGWLPRRVSEGMGVSCLSLPALQLGWVCLTPGHCESELWG